MLNKLREGAKSGVSKFILFGFMVMAVGGLVMMDVGGFFRGGVSGTNTVAKIGNSKLSSLTFDRTVRRTLSQQGLDIETAYKLGFIKQILDAEISNTLMRRASYDLGIQISDKMVAEQINRLIEPYVSDTTSTEEALTRILYSQGMTEGDFVNAIRSEMTNTMLRSALQLGSAVTTNQETQDLYQYRNEERTIETVFYPNDTVDGVQQPVDEILLPFYQAGQERYAVPESRTLTMALLSEEALAGEFDISEEELKQIYEKEIDAFTLPERRLLQQSVVSTQALALSLVEKLNQGKSLKDAVEGVTGNTESYLGEEDFQQEGLPKELADSVFSAPKETVVGPVQTALGWHVLFLKDILPPEIRPFKTIKEELRKDMMQLRLADQMYEIANDLDDRMAGGANLEDVAKEMGLTIKAIGPLRDDGSTPDNKDGIKDFATDRSKILQTTFELLENETAPVMELSDGRFAALRVDVITPKSYTPFDDVKTTLAKIWIHDQQDVLNRQKAQESLKQLAMETKSLKDLARDNKSKVKTYKLKRVDDLPPALTEEARTKFFELGQGGYALSRVKDGYIVGKIATVTLPDVTKITEEDLQSITESATRTVQNETLLVYLEHLHQKYGVKISAGTLDAIYGPGSNAF